MQKFRKFMQRVMKKEISLNDSSKFWIDRNYHSTIVRGNPNLIIVNQLSEMQQTGKTPAPIPATLPLPPYIEAGELTNYIFLLQTNNVQHISIFNYYLLIEDNIYA